MLVIRKLRISDQKEFLAMNKEFLKREHWGSSPSSMEAISILRHKSNDRLARELIETDMQYKPAQGATFVAELDGKLAGYITGRFLNKNDMLLGRLGIVDSWFAWKEYRGKGVSEMLWERMEKWFRERKCNRLELSVHPNNLHAIKIYRSKGFIDKSLCMTKRF
jgi:ribosomal protein S18 acetylase RimI-like enzyme